MLVGAFTVKSRLFSDWNTNYYPQRASDEFDEIVYNKKKTVTAWKYNTYRVRNHFIPNPTNSKFIWLKNNSKNIFLLQQNLEKVRTNKKNLWCSTENFNLTAASQLVSWSNNSTLFNYFVKIAVTFPFYIFLIFNLTNFEFVGFGTKKKYCVVNI